MFVAVAVPDNREAKADRLLIQVCLAPFRPLPQKIPVGAYAGRHAQVIVRRDLVRVVACQADNGADVSVIDERVLRENFPSAIVRAPRGRDPITSIAGSSSPIGEAELYVKYNGRASINSFTVVDAPGFPIMLGSPAWKALGLGITGVADPSATLTPSVDTPPEDDKDELFDTDAPPVAPVPERVTRLLAANAAIGADAVCSHPMSTVRVDVPPGQKPIYIFPRRRVDQHKTQAVTDQVAAWLADGVIERCRAASPWNSAMVVVPKKDSKGVVTGMRVCIDPRHINALTPDDQHPLPNIMEYLDDASGAAVISTLDLRTSFHQFNVLAEHRDILAFTWAGIQYRFRRGPFGLKALAGQFQRVMHSIFSDLPYVRVYIDDLAVFSADVQEHADHLAEVIRRLTASNLRLRPEKCHFFRACVDYLGHVVSRAGIRPAPSKVADLREVPPPSTGKQMQAFLGLVNYLRHFIPCLATMAAPLDELRNAKSIDVDDINVWTPQCQDAFLSIKDAVASAPTLCKPDWREPFLVATDASAVGLGCVLFQGSREAPRYICCASRSLTASERNYAATKKELLAIVFSLRKLRFYLAGRRFHLYTDHKALSFMFTQKGLNPMLERWLDELLEFDFSVEHLPGVLNVLPDHLSRLYSIASSEDFAARARDAALRAPAPARVAGLIRLDWKSVVVDDWVPCPGSALGGGGAAPDPDFEEIREPRRGVSVLTPQCLTGAGMLVGSVAQGVDKDDVPPLVEAPASAEPALDSHPLLAAVDLQDLASDVPPHKREALLREAHMAGHKGAKATLARLLSEGHK